MQGSQWIEIFFEGALIDTQNETVLLRANFEPNFRQSFFDPQEPLDFILKCQTCVAALYTNLTRIPSLTHT